MDNDGRTGKVLVSGVEVGGFGFFSPPICLSTWKPLVGSGPLSVVSLGMKISDKKTHSIPN